MWALQKRETLVPCSKHRRWGGACSNTRPCVCIRLASGDHFAEKQGPSPDSAQVTKQVCSLGSWLRGLAVLLDGSPDWGRWGGSSAGNRVTSPSFLLRVIALGGQSVWGALNSGMLQVRGGGGASRSTSSEMVRMSLAKGAMRARVLKDDRLPRGLKLH